MNTYNIIYSSTGKAVPDEGAVVYINNLLYNTDLKDGDSIEVGTNTMIYALRALMLRNKDFQLGTLTWHTGVVSNINTNGGVDRWEDTAFDKLLDAMCFVSNGEVDFPETLLEKNDVASH